MKPEKQTKKEVRELGVQRVAHTAGLHYQTLYRWLQGRLSPTLKTYRAICKAVETLKKES